MMEIRLRRIVKLETADIVFGPKLLTKLVGSDEWRGMDRADAEEWIIRHPNVQSYLRSDAVLATTEATSDLTMVTITKTKKKTKEEVKDGGSDQG